jgi:Uma2 family endonuclease
MGQPAEQLRQATYADLEAVPPHKVAEIIHGTLHVMPRPAPKHANTSSVLGGKLIGPFRLGEGGPGGWWILDEPELHFPNPAVKAGKDVLVPDLAGWRVERMPELPEDAFFSLAPDWICEVLSKSTEEVDREEKMPIYAREGVRHAWLIDPTKRTLEGFVLEGRRWEAIGTWRDSDRVRVAPFEAMELDLSLLWTK